MAHIAAIILAAGASRRMGADNKLLLPLGQEAAKTNLLAHSIASCRQSHVQEIFVSVGFQAESVITHIPAAVNIIHATDWQQGMGKSLAQSIPFLPPALDGVLIMLADMPAITHLHINQLIDAFIPEHFIVPTFRGKDGNPVIIPQCFFGHVAQLSDDSGARKLIAQHPQALVRVPLNTNAIHTDIDTPDDYQRWQTD